MRAGVAALVAGWLAAAALRHVTELAGLTALLSRAPLRWRHTNKNKIRKNLWRAVAETRWAMMRVLFWVVYAMGLAWLVNNGHSIWLLVPAVVAVGLACQYACAPLLAIMGELAVARVLAPPLLSQRGTGRAALARSERWDFDVDGPRNP